MKRLIKVHPDDTVAIALADLKAGETADLEGEPITSLEDTPAKHKLSLKELQPGDPVIMYGVLVGSAVHAVGKGGLLTTGNLRHESAPVSGRTARAGWTPPDVSAWKDRMFMGYHRADGQVGTANYWLFFPLVFCENRNIGRLREAFEKELKPDPLSRERLLLRKLIRGDATPENAAGSGQPVFKNVSLRFLTHQGGCGGVPEDSEMLARLLAGYVANPNVAGATVLSLGCQHLQVDRFRKAVGRIRKDLGKPLLIYEQQQLGTVDELMGSVIRDTFNALREADKLERQPAPLSKLAVGLECGGSDGFSGISANPVLGHVSDVLAAMGGTPILSEFPELCGVEQELVNRCHDDAGADKFLQLMQAYEKAATRAGSGFDMNPSPGNIRDGLITDAMKSAGAAKKGGSSPVTDVLDYGDYISRPGLNLLCTPGNDVESTTGMVGAGANVVLFTTGLGTPTGNPIAPVIKVATNTELAKRMPDIIDVDTGPVISGLKSIPEMGDELLEYLIRVASGEVTAKADRLQQHDFIPWKRGVSL